MKATITDVEVGSESIDRFQPLMSSEEWTEFEARMAALSQAVHGKTVWNVNSTARGGGVAELLAALIPYARGCRIDERWIVIEGSPEFFDVTKKVHTFLHGVRSDTEDLGPYDRARYDETMARNAATLVEKIRPGDVAFLQDPQTAGLIPLLKAHGAHVIWRSHVGIDEPNDVARVAWRFLRPYVAQADAYVFSRRAHVWDGLDGSRVHIIPPCIDPFTPKNRDLDDGARDAILRAAGLMEGTDGQASYVRADGTSGRITRQASTGGVQLPRDARIVLQVSRWDRLKDPAGVMTAFARHVAGEVDSWLVLAGPATTAVRDDPEQPEIMAELTRLRGELPEPVCRRVVLAQLPMEDADENAAIVNALQRRADVVVQKSLAEGFGLTVSEAMWKSRAVVASRVGGIEDQIEDGRSGILIDDPRDLDAFGAAVVGLLRDRERATALGRQARRRVIQRFIAPRHLMDEAAVIGSVLG